jgi:hypothetical protein
MTSFLDMIGLGALAMRQPPAAATPTGPVSGSWNWSGTLVGAMPLQDAVTGAATPAPASAPAPAPAPVATQPVAVVRGTRALSPSGSIRRTAIPTIRVTGAQVGLARGMSTYRQVVVHAGSTARTIDVPATAAGSAATAEVFAVQPHRRGGHATQVLVPVTGTRVTIPAGSEVRFVVRVTGRQPGNVTVDAGVARITARVSAATVQPLAMMTWVNPASATARGASVAQVESTLASFGVASTGAAAGHALPRHYVSAAWEAATRQPIGPVVDRILAQEHALATSAPGATVWVQVSDEQDQSAASAAATARWIARLDAELERRGSHAKLFAACQPRPHTLAYAAHLDGWAITQSSAGMTRAASMAAVRAAAQRTGRSIELMEYPGNAFFDGGTPGGAALSTASAALDGAASWFSFSANNLDVLESGRGTEARGDIGGLVAIRGGEVLPTLALAEADYGANLGAAARAVGGVARNGAAAGTVRAAAAGLDADRHGGAAADLAGWEHAIAAQLA